jgi:hypothetical protein
MMMLAVPHVVRNYQMQQALERALERLQPYPAVGGALSIVGYGPSLVQTWRDIRGPVMSISGAHDFLVQRGIEPDYHADCDPRIHKASFVKHPRAATVYLMASCCHPTSWDYLAGRRVLIWHADNGPETAAWLEQNETEPCVTFRPGPSIGIAALTLARVLGFRRVLLYGYDSCYDGDQLRAGQSEAPYSNEPIQSLEVGGVTYLTTENMKRQAEAFMDAVDGLDYELRGEGLLRAMVERQKEIA